MQTKVAFSWGVINEVLTESKLMPNFRAIRKLTRAEPACVEGGGWVGGAAGEHVLSGMWSKWDSDSNSSIVSIYAL